MVASMFFCDMEWLVRGCLRSMGWWRDREASNGASVETTLARAASFVAYCILVRDSSFLHLDESRRIVFCTHQSGMNQTTMP